MTDDMVWRRAAATLRADEALLGHDGALRLWELERRVRLASRLVEMGIVPTDSATRNRRLFRAALMREHGVRSWSEAEAAHSAARPGDHELSGVARSAELVVLLEPCWPPPRALQPRPSPAFPIAKPAPPRVDSAPPEPDEPVPFNARTFPQNEDGSFPPLPLSKIAALLDAGRLPRNGRAPNARPEW